jgi:hypothetical protein
MGTHPWWTALALAALLAWPIWHWRGPLLSSLSDVSNLLLIAAGIWFGMNPAKAQEIELTQTRRRRIIGGVLIVVGIVGLVSGYFDKKATRLALGQLVAASASQATKQDIEVLRAEVGGLRKDTKAGFGDVVGAINTLGDRLVGKTFKPTPKPPVSEEAPKVVPPPAIEHILYTQKDVPVPEGGPKYGKQVVIQTDRLIQPTQIRIIATGKIENANFSVVGLPIVMSYRTIIQSNILTIGFTYPPFTPESPIVVTLLSNSHIDVASVKLIP